MMSRTVKAFDDEFPLRMIPKGDPDLIEFQGFVDKLGPAVTMTHDEAVEHTKQGSNPKEDEWSIKAIIGTKTKKKRKHYIILWDSDEVTLEPKDMLEEDVPDMLKEYEDRVTGLVAEQCDPDPDRDKRDIDNGRLIAGMEYQAHVVDAFLSKLTDSTRMIEELIKKQKQKGTVDQWRPGVEGEFEAVRDIRFEEVSQETKARVIREGLAMRLRMILEHKKDGRMKGRLVGQGFLESEAQYGKNIDSPVASMSAVRILLFMGGEEYDVIASGDITKAFLKADDYGPEEEDRFVTFREYRGGPQHVWRLKGPLYGSKDSPYRWWDSFVKFVTQVQTLVEHGFDPKDKEGKSIEMNNLINTAASNFERGVNEPCIFYNKHTGMRIALYVDDVITRGSEKETRALFKAIDEKYPLRSWGILSPDNPLIHLGFTITEEVIDGVKHRYMSQEKDVIQFLEDHDIIITKAVTCPMPSRAHILNKPTLLDKEGIKTFRSIVGVLSFYAVSLRYDIARSVCRVQTYQQEPTQGALEAAIRIAMYVGSTAGFRIGGPVKHGINKMEYFTDSDHAGDKELTYRSHSGVMITLNDIPIHWRSKKQPKTVISPAHAEIFACSEGLKEARWITWIMQDLHIPIPSIIILQVDNKQVISFKKGTCLNSRLRGTANLRWEWVQELRDAALSDIIHVDTRFNKADILTKCLDNTEFERQVGNIQLDKIKKKEQGQHKQ